MSVQWQAWGTTVTLDVTDPAALASARRILRGALAEAEGAADADRAGSEVHRLLRSGGRARAVRPELSALVATALDAAEHSGGLVDPTVGPATIPLRRALGRAPRAAGGILPVCTALPQARPRPASGWRTVEWGGRHVALPAGAALDLTATAKARTARLAATRIAERLGVGALVELGGDVATAGPSPRRGWLVAPLYLARQTVELPPTTALAACRADGVVDPATGRPVQGPWQAVAVLAADVVVAKTAAVAALVHGLDAEAYLDAHPAVIRHLAVRRVWPGPSAARRAG